MRKLYIKHGLAAIAVIALGLSGVPALAINPNGQAHAQAATSAAQTGSDAADSHKPADPTGQAAEHKAMATTKLADAKLKACQNREKAIDNIMSRISDRGQKQLDLFSTIATRVETFYTDKDKTLSNYDALVADVNTQQVAAQTAVGNISSASSGFACDGSDPKGFVNAFKGSLSSEIDALKAYRTSIKNLIVGVKSVQGVTSSSSATTSGSAQTTTGGDQ